MAVQDHSAEAADHLAEVAGPSAAVAERPAVADPSAAAADHLAAEALLSRAGNACMPRQHRDGPPA